MVLAKVVFVGGVVIAMGFFLACEIVLSTGVVP